MSQLEATPIEGLGDLVAGCACTSFRKASLAVTMMFDEMLAPCGLLSTQLAILVAIEVVAPPSLARLARELVMDSSTLARNLKPLEQRGLITKTPVGDRRRRSIVVTAEGRQLIGQAIPLWAAAQEQFIDQLGRDRWPRMRTDLGQSVEAARMHV